VEWNDHAQPVCLPDSDEEFNGLQGILAGWGSSQEADPKGIISASECAEFSISIKGSDPTMDVCHLHLLPELRCIR